MSSEIEEAKNKVAGCFGCEDYLFAGHPMDEARAKKLRKLIKDGIYKWDDIELIMYGYMARRGCSREHIDTEMDKIKKYFNIK